MPPAIDAVEVEIASMAAGGDGVAHLDDGRVVFVEGAVAGDRARVRLTDERRRFARAVVVDVVAPGPGRIAPPCPNVAEGCGGCGWQHIDLGTQRRLKAGIVTDALVHIGGLDPSALPEVDPGPDLPPGAFRTTVRAAVDADGRAGFRVAHAHDVVPVGDAGCLVAHPLVDGVLRAGRFAGCREVTVRASAATGERIVIADPTRRDVELPEDAATTLVGADELRGRRRVWLTETVAGRPWRISAGSFFQARPDGAAALVDAVAAGVVAGGAAPGRVADLYAGVGLLAGGVADRLDRVPRRLEVVEANRSAVADAKVNLADLAGRADLRIVRVDVRRWRPSAMDAVVADPSRHGLGAGAVARIVATGADMVVLVSCDPGALGRDAGLLAGAGYRLAGLALVDLFAHTPHVEAVSRWQRAPRHPDGGAAT